MKDKDKTKEQLISELAELRQRMTDIQNRLRPLEVATTEQGQADGWHTPEALLHSLIESLPQNIYSKDLQGRFTFANQRYCATEGKSLTEILGKTDFDLHPPELAKKYRKDDHHVIETQQIFETVEEHKPLNGESLYVQVIKTPLYDSQRQVTGTLGIFWDITARKQAEEKLRKSEERYRRFVEDSPNPIFSVDGKGIVQTWNQACEQVFQYGAEEIVGQAYHKLLWAPQDRPVVEAQLDQVWQGQSLSHQNMTYRAKDGTQRYTSSRLYPLRDYKSVRECVFANTNITGQVQAESQRDAMLEALKRRNRELTTLYEAATAISSDLSLDIVLQTVTEQMTQALDLGRCTLSLWNRDADHIAVLVDYSTTEPDSTIPKGTIYDLKDYPATRRVLETRQPVVVQHDDPAADRAELALMEEENILTLLMLPLVARDRVVGLAELIDDVEARDYTPEELRLAQSLVAQAAIAIENAGMYEETQQRLREQTMLFHASQRLSSAPLQAEEIAEIAVRQLAGVMESTECSFSLLAPQGSTLRVLAGFWIEDEIEHWAEDDESFDLTDYPATARAMETLQPLVVQASDPNADPAELAYMRENETATLAIIPLAVKGQAIGVIELETGEERHYTPEQLNMAMTLANQAAVALENARLYEAVQQELAERVQTEKALKSSEERLRILFESAPDAYYLNDLGGTFVDGNKAAEQLIGYRKDELIGKSFLKLNLLSPGQIPRVTALLAQSAQGQPTGPDEFILNRGDGEQVATEIRTFPVKIRGQTLVLGIARDITERRRSEEALRESEARYRILFEQANDGIHIVNANDEIIEVNRRACEMMGYSRKELLDMRVSDLQAPEVRGQTGSAVKTEWTQHGNAVFEALNIHRDGTRIPVEVSISKVTGLKGELFISIVRDITERKQAEEALHQYTVELEARNEELDAFSHTVAHDLKNPLSLIVGFAEVLKEEYGQELDQVALGTLHTIAWNGRKMGNIIDELLLLAGVRKMGAVEMRALDMAHIVAEALGRLVHTVEQRQAEIMLPDTWPAAFGYGPWVEEVWVNYLSNAIKYGGKPPRVELGFDRVDSGPWLVVSGQNTPTNHQPLTTTIRFWVRDNGPGLTPEEQGRLFKSFERLDQVRAKGHGLGLSIVRRIVEKLDGEVGVESEIGQGSVFWFTLPRPNSPARSRALPLTRL